MKWLSFLILHVVFALGLSPLAFGSAADRLLGFAPDEPAEAIAGSEAELPGAPAPAVAAERDAIIEKYSGRKPSLPVPKAPEKPEKAPEKKPFVKRALTTEKPRKLKPAPQALLLPVLFLGHTPETLHAARLLRNSDGHFFLNLEASFFSGQWGLDFSDLLGPLNVKPRASFGLISDLSGPAEKTAYTSFFISVQKETHGLGIKGIARLKGGESFLSPLLAGNLAAYYFVNFINVFSKWDFVSLYAGWFSGPAAFDFASDADLLSAARDLAGGGWENLLAGFFWNWDIASPHGFGLEAGPGMISATAYLGLK